MKTLCPNCEKETECEFTAELYECKECGEDFAKYIVSRNCNVSDVSITQDVTTPEPPEGACGMSEISEKAIKKDVPFITYIIHDKNMKNGRTVTVYKPTQEYYILFELIKFRRLPSTFPDIGITVISEGLEPSPSDVSVTEDVLTDIKTPRSIENNNPDYYKHELARRDEIIARLKAELAELNDKAVFIQFENEDELPADISNDVYSTMFNCSHVDGVRLFPYIEENGQKYFLVMLREDE